MSFSQTCFWCFYIFFCFCILYNKITRLVYSLCWIWKAVKEPSLLPTCALLLASLGWLGLLLWKETYVQYCFLFVQLFVAIYIRYKFFAGIIIMLESYSGVINLQFSVLGQLLLQCPPFRLSYQGLGEPLCFAAFGPFATCAFYLLHGSSRLPQLPN